MNKTNIIQLSDYSSIPRPLNVLVARPEHKGQALVASLQAAAINAQHCALFCYQAVEKPFYVSPYLPLTIMLN